MSKTHKLKTWTEFFIAIVYGVKTVEIRKNDRNFEVGDRLILQEYNPDTEEYTGLEIEADVTHILEGGQFGIEKGYVAMSISK